MKPFKNACDLVFGYKYSTTNLGIIINEAFSEARMQTDEDVPIAPNKLLHSPLTSVASNTAVVISTYLEIRYQRGEAVEAVKRLKKSFISRTNSTYFSVAISCCFKFYFQLTIVILKRFLNSSRSCGQQ